MATVTTATGQDTSDIILGESSTTSALAPGSASTGEGGDSSPTVLTALHTLLRAHVAAHPQPTLPYLHPYAPLSPAPWKGKARESLPSPQDQLELLRKIRDNVDAARNVLARGREEKERVRLARAMREVVTHQSALLPLGTTLASLPPYPRSTSVSALTSLTPVELVSALSTRLGIQIFLEESQFGLLKTSLTLAGGRFVVDIDLELDASSGPDDDEDDAMTGTAPVTAAPTPMPLATPRPEERGKVRLSKLTASHVTPSGGAGKSDWIARVLRAALEAHLGNWNDAGEDSAARIVALDHTSRSLEAALGELKAIDDLAAVGGELGPDLFADLEALASGLKRVAKTGDASGVKIYLAEPSIYPSFYLLPPHGKGAASTTLRLRPASKGEHVPPPPPPMPTEPDSTAIVVDDAGTGDTENANKPMANGAWLVEIVDAVECPVTPRGLVVRRTWLMPSSTGSESEEAEANAWAASIKAEGILYQGALEPTSPSTLPLFPYSADFVHSSSPAKSNATSLEQHWSIVHPGPEGFVVGRVGLPSSWDAFGTLLHALRDQLVINVLFASVFSPLAKVEASDGDDDGNGVDDNDGSDNLDLYNISSAPTALPLTVSMHQRSLHVSFPLPYAEGPDAATVTLKLRPSSSSSAWIPESSKAGSAVVDIDWTVEPALGDDDVVRAKLDDAVHGVRSRGVLCLVETVQAIDLALQV